MKFLIFITLFFCLVFPACKAKNNDETSSKKTVNKISRQIHKQKLNATVQTVQTVQTENLKSWKKQVSKKLKPIPIKPKAANSIIASTEKNISAAKNVRKKELAKADKLAKSKFLDTTRKLDLSQKNNFGKIQKIELETAK